MAAIVVGETSVIRQLHALVVEDETRYRSEVFRCKELEVGREGYRAILYRAGLSRCRPASVGTLRSEDAHNILQGRAVCEYLYCFAESDQDAWSECEYRGTVVANGSSEKDGSLNKVNQVFEEKCKELGVDGAALLNEFPTEEDGEDPRGPESRKQPLVVAPPLDLAACDIPF